MEVTLERSNAKRPPTFEDLDANADGVVDRREWEQALTLTVTPAIA